MGQVSGQCKQQGKSWSNRTLISNLIVGQGQQATIACGRSRLRCKRSIELLAELLSNKPNFVQKRLEKCGGFRHCMIRPCGPDGERISLAEVPED